MEDDVEPECVCWGGGGIFGTAECGAGEDGAVLKTESKEL